MRTRCPHCTTSFRITPEQLRAKAGKVRCGHCQVVFDAFDSLIDETGPATVMPLPPSAPTEAPTPAPAPIAAQEPAPQAVEDEGFPPTQPPDAFDLPADEPDTEASASASAPEDVPVAEPLPEPTDETPEESARQAREAGLMAARELQDTAAYDRWSAGTLVLDANGRIVDGSGQQRVLWPFIAAAVALTVILVAQIGQHFRTELAQRSPSLRSVFEAFGSDIPLPREVEQVSIEASDLQADAARGLLVLQATLKNRSPYAQAWPALELTLTNSDDAVVTRRVLHAADYLPPKTDTAAFAGASEIGLRLWIESKTPAAGYRLYVFYP